jgi:ribosomal protein S18 acetylase RimI-like enzyme
MPYTKLTKVFADRVPVIYENRFFSIAMSSQPFVIKPAVTDTDLHHVGELFRSYVESLGIDLGYQDFESELASLPGKYAPPKGALFIAKNGQGHAIGCAGLRPLSENGVCEMKRLYVAPIGRGMGLGKALMHLVLAEAARLGYQEIRLDTLPNMAEAISMYKKVGFVEIPAYYETPSDENIFMSLKLDAGT